MKHALRLIGWNLLFLVAYAAFYRASPWPMQRTAAVVSWNAGIESFEIHGETDSTTCFRPRLRYTYEVAGRQYSASRLSLTTSCFSEAAAEAAAAKLRVGTRINIYYDVLWPQRATILRDGSAALGALFLTALCVHLLGVRGLVRAWRGATADGGAAPVPAAPAPNAPRIASGARPVLMMRLAGGLLLVAVGLLIGWNLSQSSDPALQIVFPAMVLLGGAVVIGYALLGLRAWLVLGEAWLRLDPVAPRVGAPLRGSIQFERPPPPHWRLSLALVCRQVCIDQDDDRYLTTLWRDEAPLPAAAIAAFAFELPAKAEPSAAEDAAGAHWHLELRGRGAAAFKRRFEFRLFARRR